MVFSVVTPMPWGISQLEIAFQEDCGDVDCSNVLGIDKLFYQFPIGPGFMAIVGPRVGQEDMLALWPSGPVPIHRTQSRTF